jgi:hypothetical protein
MSAIAAPKHVVPEKKPIKFSNLLLGASLNLFEVTTLGQPLEVTKTTMAANRGDSFAGALSRIWGRGGVLGCMLSFPPHLPFSPSLYLRLTTAALWSSLRIFTLANFIC